MNLGIFSALLFAGVFSYIFLGCAFFRMLTSHLKWRDNDAAAICSIGWPVTVAFWLLIGFPVMFIMWSLRCTGRRLRRKTRTEVVK